MSGRSHTQGPHRIVMKTVQLDGAALQYVEHGAGTPVVLVHGSASDWRTWESQLDRLATGFRAIAYSRRYHWPNDPIPDEADYSMPEHVNDLIQLLRALDAAPAHLVGHSYGAVICLLLAMRAPQLVRSLVLAEPPAITLFVSNSPRPLELIRLLFSRPRTAACIVRFGARGIAPAMKAMKRDEMEEALRIFGTATLGRDTFLSMTQQRREQARANLIKAELLGSGFPPLVDTEIRAVRIPTLLVSGEDSPSLFHRLLDRLEELLPEAERVELPHASHIMHEDNPEAYFETVNSFVQVHGGE